MMRSASNHRRGRRVLSVGSTLVRRNQGCSSVWSMRTVAGLSSGGWGREHDGAEESGVVVRQRQRQQLQHQPTPPSPLPGCQRRSWARSDRKCSSCRNPFTASVFTRNPTVLVQDVGGDEVVCAAPPSAGQDGGVCGMTTTPSLHSLWRLIAERLHGGCVGEERRQPVRGTMTPDCCAAHRSDITPPSAMSWSACSSMVVSRRQQVRIPP